MVVSIVVYKGHFVSQIHCDPIILAVGIKSGCNFFFTFLSLKAEIYLPSPFSGLARDCFDQHI